MVIQRIGEMCPLHGDPEWQPLWIGIEDIAKEFQISNATVYSLAQRNRFWYSRSVGPIRTTIEDVTYMVDDEPILFPRKDEEELFVKSCQAWYDSHLESNPSRIGVYLSQTKPTLERCLRKLATHFVDKRARLQKYVF